MPRVLIQAEAAECGKRGDGQSVKFSPAERSRIHQPQVPTVAFAQRARRYPIEALVPVRSALRTKGRRRFFRCLTHPECGYSLRGVLEGHSVSAALQCTVGGNDGEGTGARPR